MRFRVSSREEASAALSYFNHFHDSFVDSLTLRVSPDSRQEFGFSVPVLYEAVLRLEHTNYPDAQRKELRRQTVEIAVGGITSLGVGDLVSFDNMLGCCTIEVEDDGTICLDVGGDGLMTFACRALSIEEVGSESSA